MKTGEILTGTGGKTDETGKWLVGKLDDGDSDGDFYFIALRLGIKVPPRSTFIKDLTQLSIKI